LDNQASNDQIYCTSYIYTPDQELLIYLVPFSLPLGGGGPLSYPRVFSIFLRFTTPSPSPSYLAFLCELPPGIDDEGSLSLTAAAVAINRKDVNLEASLGENTAAGLPITFVFAASLF
jgi:hypothetical protein